jgi:hypothetical protein
MKTTTPTKSGLYLCNWNHEGEYYNAFINGRWCWGKGWPLVGDDEAAIKILVPRILRAVVSGEEIAEITPIPTQYVLDNPILTIELIVEFED